MNNKLYVGNLSYSTGEADLRETFEPYGALLSVAIISDRMTGQPRGFGFVEYESAGDAQRAIDSLNGTDVGGRSINVSIARERDSAPRFGGGGGGGGSQGSQRRGGSGGGKSARGGNRW